MSDQTLFFSGDSPALEHLFQLALDHSPWLRCDVSQIEIDWPAFFQALGTRDPRYAGWNSGGHIDLLQQLAPGLALNHFCIKDRIGAERSHRGDEKGKNLLEACGKTREIPMDDELCAMLDMLRKESVRAEHALIHEVCDNPATIDKWRSPEMERIIKQRKDEIFRAGQVGGILGLQYVNTYTFHPARRFLLHSGPMHPLLRGHYADDIDRKPPLAKRQAGHACLRRLIRLHIDLLSAMAEPPQEAQEASSSTMIEIIQRMGDIEGRLYNYLLQPSLAGNPAGMAEARMTFLSRSPSYRCLHRDLGNVSARQVSIWCLGSQQFGDAALGYLYRSGSRNTAEVSPLQKNMTKVHDWLNRLQHQPAKGQEQLLQHAINLLVFYSPLLTLFASGFLASYPLATQSDGTMDFRCGICLSPWVTTSYLCRFATGFAPMTFIHAGINDQEDSAPDGANSTTLSEKDAQADQRPTGARLWQLVMP